MVIFWCRGGIYKFVNSEVVYDWVKSMYVLFDYFNCFEF